MKKIILLLICSFMLLACNNSKVGDVYGYNTHFFEQLDFKNPFMQNASVDYIYTVIAKEGSYCKYEMKYMKGFEYDEDCSDSNHVKESTYSHEYTVRTAMMQIDTVSFLCATVNQMTQKIPANKVKFVKLNDPTEFKHIRCKDRK